MDQQHASPQYIYTYSHRQDEHSLCYLEMRSFFGKETDQFILKSDVAVMPSRSPFIKERIEILYEGDTLEKIYAQAEQIDMLEETFKVIFVKINDLDSDHKIEYQERLGIEREIGMRIHGEADVKNPQHTFGIVPFGGRWYLGHYFKNEAVWFHNMRKPQNYSIALNTRLARAAANILVPNPVGIQAIDPCCGIGTVLVEALSMDINIVGRDINPHIAQGARANIKHFGLKGEVTLGDIADISEHYDAAIVDMPYNLFSTTTPEEQLSILKHARRIADKVVVITIENIDEMIAEAGFSITDRGEAKKGAKGVFSRQVLVCH